MVTIANLKHTNIGFRCDRQTPLGNPFVLIKDNKHNRSLSICAFRMYINLVVLKNKKPHEARHIVAEHLNLNKEEGVGITFTLPTRVDLINSLKALLIDITSNTDQVLLCWCFPKYCHTQILINLAAYTSENNINI